MDDRGPPANSQYGQIPDAAMNAATPQRPKSVCRHYIALAASKDVIKAARSLRCDAARWVDFMDAAIEGMGKIPGRVHARNRFLFRRLLSLARARATRQGRPQP